MATNRTRYDVVYVDSMWRVKSGGIVLSSHQTKDAAVTAGVAAARANEPSQLFIHRQDGTFEEERTYGDDPYPPEG